MPRRRLLFSRGLTPLVFFLLLLLTLIARLAWGWHIQRQIDAQLAVIRARGEPTSLAEVVHVPIPDGFNAATDQIKAAQVFHFTEGFPSISEDGLPPYPADWLTAIDKLDSSRKESFALVRRSRQFARADFSSLPVAQAGAGSGAPPLVFELNWLYDAFLHTAFHRHTQGDDAEAIERIRDLLHVSASLRQDHFFHYAIGAAGGADFSAAHSALLIGPGLRPDIRRPAERAQVLALIHSFLDTEDVLRAFRHAAAVDHVMTIDAFRKEGETIWLLRPLRELQLLRYLRDVTAVTAPLAPVVPRHDVPYTDWFAFDTRHFQRYLPFVATVIAERRAAAISLACQLHRIDRGRFPRNLDELVPAYLPAVPVDPFLSPPGPIGYVFASPDRPLLNYGSGAPQPIPAKPVFTFQYGGIGAIQQYRDLNRFAALPLPQVPQNDPRVPDNPRDNAQPDDRAK